MLRTTLLSFISLLFIQLGFAQYEERAQEHYLFDDVTFESGYATSKINEAFYDRENNLYQLVIYAEKERINPSPWYAFKINNKKEEDVQVKVSFDGYKTRYSPYYSTDQKNWIKLNSHEVKEKDLHLTIPGHLGSEVWISAQPSFDSEYTQNWIDSVAQVSGGELSEIGKSHEGRVMKRLIVGNPNLKKVIMVIGRQHPPEVTGFLGMKAFVDEFLKKNKMTKKFLKEHSLVFYPMVNPDGIDAGNWRLSRGEKPIDMNRDWGLFSQVESKLISDDFDDLIVKHQSEVLLSFDFHSTFYDIFYLVNTEPESVSMRWVDLFEQDFGDDYKAKYTADISNSVIFKNWFYEKYGAESITYEVGDDTEFPLIQKKGKSSARAIMRLFQK